jgi:hypothetical protein
MNWEHPHFGARLMIFSTVTPAAVIPFQRDARTQGPREEFAVFEITVHCDDFAFEVLFVHRECSNVLRSG